MDEAARFGGRGLLQPAAGGDFDGTSCRDGNPRVAVRTRGAQTQGHIAAAPGTGMCLDRNDLAGLVGTLSRAARWTGAAQLPHPAGIVSRRRHIADRTSRRVPQWRKRTRLEAWGSREWG